jgi:hypothetical protein
LEYATLEWAERFNKRRLLEPLGHRPPGAVENLNRGDMPERLVRAHGTGY